jgi:cellulose synthase/poly-beta-1,6-N-acetylglucosamine synthase-like glycosyltransferase
MLWPIVLPTFAVFIISIINFFTIRTPNLSSEVTEFVSVIVPLRNEAENISGLVNSLLSQKSLTNVEYLFLNDNSEDESYDLLISALSHHTHAKVIQGSPMPSGWIGKTWALQQLLEESRGEIIVSIDADVLLTPDAINKSISLMKSRGLDFLSPYPRQITHSLSERLIQPLLQWSWMSTLLLGIAEKASFSSMAVANGQFFIVRKRALLLIGGYESVKADVLDDVFLARRLMKTGAHGVVVNGASIAECRMYSSWSEIEAGYGKSLRHAFGSPFGSLCAIFYLFLTGIAPILFALTGSAWGWLAFTFIIATRVMSASRARTRVVDSLLHPISSTLLIYLILYSYLMRGNIQWKGRTV